MIRIEHIALWSKDIETLKNFYVKYFNATSNNGYHNPKKRFKSYFLSFESGSRLEIMQLEEHLVSQDEQIKYYGYSHIAISVGTKEKVIELTNKLKKDGYEVTSDPRNTGDGYYESVVLDPEGNSLEITI